MEISRCLVTLLRALLEIRSLGYVCMCASVKMQVGSARTGRKRGGKKKNEAVSIRTSWSLRRLQLKDEEQRWWEGETVAPRAWLPL